MAKDVWHPGQYEKFKNERSLPFFDLLDLIQGNSFSRVIDLGCGSGELTEILHQKVGAGKTLGLDNSPNMLAKAKTIKSKGLSFVEAEIESVNSFEKFDLIFSNAALQWCSDHKKIFSCIRECLKPLGEIAIQMPMNHDYPTHVIARQMALEEPFRSWLREEGGERKPSLLLPEDYASLLFKLGFREQKVLLKVYGHVLDSREGVIEWVKGTLLTYYQSRLTPEQYVFFLDAYREKLFQQLRDAKPFFYPFKRLLLWGKL